MHGIDDIGPGRCIGLEIKSLDPRSQERLPKEEHTFQVNTALGLIRDLTDHQPEYAVITYIDASFLDNIREFVIKFDVARYLAAEQRAWEAISAESPMNLLPEGKLAGGKECRYCAWANSAMPGKWH